MKALRPYQETRRRAQVTTKIPVGGTNGQARCGTLRWPSKEETDDFGLPNTMLPGTRGIGINVPGARTMTPQARAGQEELGMTTRTMAVHYSVYGRWPNLEEHMARASYHNPENFCAYYHRSTNTINNKAVHQGRMGPLNRHRRPKPVDETGGQMAIAFIAMRADVDLRDLARLFYFRPTALLTTQDFLAFRR